MKHTILFTVAALLALPSTLAAGGKASHRGITWEDPVSGARLHALYQNELSDDRMVSRVLAQTPGGRHVFLVQTLDAPTGVQTTTLVDERSGWRAVLETRTGLEAPTLSGLFRASDELVPGAPVGVRLFVPDHRSIEAEVPAGFPVEMQEAFVEHLAAEGLADRVAEVVPEEVRPAVFFLDGSLSPDALASEPGKVDNIAHSLRDVVAVLAGALRAAGIDVRTEETHRWPMEVGPPQKGLEVQSPELRDLLARFEGEALPVEQ